MPLPPFVKSKNKPNRDRGARLAAALRANLKRRKERQRAGASPAKPLKPISSAP